MNWILVKMKIFLFCILISYSLSADNFTKPTLSRHSSQKRSLNDPNRTDDQAKRLTQREHCNPSESLEPEQSLHHDSYFRLTSREPSGLDSHRGDDHSRHCENPNLETSNDERHGGAGGTDRPRETWSNVDINLPGSRHPFRVPSTDGLSAMAESSHNVHGGSDVEPYMNIPFAKGSASVRPKSPKRWVGSCAPPSDNAGINLPSFAGTFPDYCQPSSISTPRKPCVPVRNELVNQESARTDQPSSMASVTPLDLNLEQSSNSADPNYVLASRSLQDDEASPSTPAQNYVTRAETPRTGATQPRLDTNMFHYIHSLYTLKRLLSELDQSFGTPELVRQSFMLEHSQISVDLLRQIQENLIAMANLGTEVDGARFGINTEKLNLVLSTITHLTPFIDVYLVDIHYNAEAAKKRIDFIMHITRKLYGQLDDFLESAKSELECFMDNSPIDVYK